MNTKKIFAFVFIYFTLLAAHAQIPQAINYQGAARSADGKPLSLKNIAIKISILKNTTDGNAEYIEIHKATTTSLGLFSLMIGKGDASLGVFNKIAWSSETKFIKVEYDPAGGSNYVLSGISQVLSVPYALEAGGLTLTDENGNLWKVTANTDGTLKSVANYKTPTPTNLKGSVANALKIVLQWNFNTLNEKGVEIYRSYGNSNNFSLLTTLPLETRQFADSTLIDDTLTYYKIKGISSYGSSDFSNMVSVKTPKYILPKPTNLMITRTSATVQNLSWDYLSTPNTTFQLFSSINNGTSWMPLRSYSQRNGDKYGRDSIYSGYNGTNFIMGTIILYKVSASQKNIINNKTYYSDFANISYPTYFETISCNATSLNLNSVNYYHGSSYSDFSNAINYCSNLVSYGFSDWYVPSKDELDCIYAAKNTLNYSNVYNGEWWSSTESGTSAYSKNFTDGVSKLEIKTVQKAFICVRK